MVSDSGSNHGVDAIFGPIDSLPCSEICRGSIDISFLQFATASSSGSQFLDERAPRAGEFW